MSSYHLDRMDTFIMAFHPVVKYETEGIFYKLDLSSCLFYHLHNQVVGTFLYGTRLFDDIPYAVSPAFLYLFINPIVFHRVICYGRDNPPGSTFPTPEGNQRPLQ